MPISHITEGHHGEKLFDGVTETDWVRLNAYYRWVNSGGQEGRSLEFWLEAKNQFRETYYPKFAPIPITETQRPRGLLVRD